MVKQSTHNRLSLGSIPSWPTIYIHSMNSSPQRGTFHSQCRREDVIAEGRDPDQDEDYLEAVERERTWNDLVKKREAANHFKQNNLEYDLRSTDWICNKAKASETYAQNLYASLCNQDWQKNDVWPLLKGETYSCSWRYAGGIVADMREEGDYIDWYCSGIRGGDEPDAVDVPYEQKKFVPEGKVTDEIREDFFKLGWIPVNNDEDIEL